MADYLDDTGLERFFDNIKNLMHGPSYQQVASYLNAHPESLNDPVADYLDENPTATIPDESISTAKLADSSVTSAKIADGAVTTNDLANGAVISAKIADGTIATSDLADSSITTAKIADSAVTTTKIVDGAITANKLASGAIPTMSTTTPGIAKVGAGLTMNNGAVELDADTTGISGAVEAWLDAHPEATTTVEDGAITTAKIVNDAVTFAKMGNDVKDSIGDVHTEPNAVVLGDAVNAAVKGNLGETIVVATTTNYYYYVIDVSRFETLSVTTYNAASSSYTNCVYFTDDADVILGTGIPNTLSAGMITVSVTVPDGASKAYVLTYKNGYGSVAVDGYSPISLQNQIDALNEQIGEIDLESVITDIYRLSTEVGNVRSSTESQTIQDVTSGGLQGGVGEQITVTGTTNYTHGYVAVEVGEMLSVTVVQSVSSSYPSYVFAMTDTIENDGTIVSVWGVPASVAYERHTYEITVPSDTNYVYVAAASTVENFPSNAGVLKHVIYSLQEQIDNISFAPRMVLPSKSYAIVGHEWNLYYGNLFRSLTDRYNVSFTITSTYMDNPIMLEECLRVVPTSNDIGTHTVTVIVQERETGRVVDSGSFTLEVLADRAITGKKVVFIGDSLTDADVYPAEIQYHLSNGGIESIGTISNTATIGGVSYSVNDEGRSGWATYDYTRTVPNYRTNYSNAFWDGSAFNFAYYVEQTGFSDIDAVVIGLGTNGLSNQAAALSAMDIIIESIHDYDQTIPILISLITPPATQDGCGIHNGLQSADGQLRKQLDLVESYIAKYDDVLENVYVAELYFNLDRKTDYPTIQQAVSSRNPMTVYRQTDNVHPNEYGYLKIADVYYANLVKLLS